MRGGGGPPLPPADLAEGWGRSLAKWAGKTKRKLDADRHKADRGKKKQRMAKREEEKDARRGLRQKTLVPSYSRQTILPSTINVLNKQSRPGRKGQVKAHSRLSVQGSEIAAYSLKLTAHSLQLAACSLQLTAIIFRLSSRHPPDVAAGTTGAARAAAGPAARPAPERARPRAGRTSAPGGSPKRKILDFLGTGVVGARDGVSWVWEDKIGQKRSRYASNGLQWSGGVRTRRDPRQAATPLGVAAQPCPKGHPWTAMGHERSRLASCGPD
eukprot:gene24183-biopygen13427